MSIIILLLAIFGLANSIYLAYHYKKEKPLVCVIGKGCNTVAQSKWTKTFGISNTSMGIAYYISIILGVLIIQSAPTAAALIIFLMKIAAGLALAASIYLTIIQKFVIKEFCSYCILSAVINLALFCFLIFA